HNPKTQSPEEVSFEVNVEFPPPRSPLRTLFSLARCGVEASLKSELPSTPSAPDAIQDYEPDTRRMCKGFASNNSKRAVDTPPHLCHTVHARPRGLFLLTNPFSVLTKTFLQWGFTRKAEALQTIRIGAPIQ